MSQATTPTPPISQWDHGLQTAMQQGIIEALPSTENHMPWPTMILTFVGALISTLLFFACFLLIAYQSGAIESAGFYYIFGLFFAGGALSVLRLRSQGPLYIEYLMFIALVVGIALICAGFVVSNFIDSFDHVFKYVFLLAALLSAICALILPMSWARAIASFSAACWLYTYWYASLNIWRYEESASTLAFYAYSLLLPAVAGALLVAQHQLQQRARWKRISLLEPILNGWFVATIITLCFSVGMTMFVAGVIPMGSTGISTTLGALFARYMQSPLTWITLACLPLAWWWSAMRWPALRHWRVIALLVVFTAFACLTPKLALCLGLGIMALATQRYRLAILAAIGALWIVGALYYSVSMPLLEKSLWLGVTGIALLAVSFAGRPQAASPHSNTYSSAGAAHPFASKPLVSVALLVLAALATFGGVNASIYKQEQLRAQGAQVLIALAPVDPRSLMQGDYMIVNFDISSALTRAKNTDSLYAYLDIDENGVASLRRQASAGEPRIALVQRNGRWTLPADAWFFQEGDAGRWQVAKYGIFKVDASGQSALVGLATADRQPIDAKGSASAL